MRNKFMPSKSGIKAFLDQIYDVKFSKHTTLLVVLLSMIYTVYRTQHYLATEYLLEVRVAWPTAIFIELLVLSAAAATFVSLRNQYIAELKKEDATRSYVGIAIAGMSLFASFVALLFVAWSDAWLLTKEYIPTLIMTLTQFAQMLFVIGFITASDLDERSKLRKEFENYEIQLEREKQAEIELQKLQAEQIAKVREREQYEKEYPFACACGARFKTRGGLGKHKKTCI